MYRGGFGYLLRLALLFGTTNPLNMALFFTVVANLVLVKTTVHLSYVCFHHSGTMRVVAGFACVGLLCSVNMSTRGTWLELSSLYSEVSRMAVSNATAISTALEYLSLASDNNRFWICIFWSPQASLSRSASYRFPPKLKCVTSFLSSVSKNKKCLLLHVGFSGRNEIFPQFLRALGSYAPG